MCCQNLLVIVVLSNQIALNKPTRLTKQSISPITVPGCERQEKCNSPGIFSGLVVFLGVFFRKFGKNRKKSQSGSEYCIKLFLDIIDLSR